LARDDIAIETSGSPRADATASDGSTRSTTGTTPRPTSVTLTVDRRGGGLPNDGSAVVLPAALRDLLRRSARTGERILETAPTPDPGRIPMLPRFDAVELASDDEAWSSPHERSP
jgi:hypothetical protein